MEIKKNSKLKLEIHGYYHELTKAFCEEAALRAEKQWGIPLNKIEIVKKYKQKADICFSGKNISNDVLDTVLNQQKLNAGYIDFIKEHYPNFDTQLFFDIDKKVTEQMPSIDNFDTRNRRYEILYFKGRNILSFEDVYRDFSEKGVTVIHSTPENQGGKSALSKIPAFLIFGNKIKYVTNSVKYEQIFNKYSKENTAYVEGEIKIDGDIYYLKRVLTKTKTGVTHKFHIYRYDEINGSLSKQDEAIGLKRKAVNLSIKNAVASLSKFEKTIGTYDDYVFASYYEYHNIEKWVQTTKTSRYRLFCEYLGLALLEAKYQVANKMLNTHLKESLVSKYNIKTLEEGNLTLKNSNNDNLVEKDKNQKSIDDLKKEQNEINAKIKKLYESKFPIDSKYETLDVGNIEKSILETKNKIESEILTLSELERLTLIKPYNISIEDTLQENKKLKLDIINIKPSEFQQSELSRLSKILTEVSIPEKNSIKEKATQNQLNEYSVQERTLESDIASINEKIKKTPDESVCSKCGNVELSEVKIEEYRNEIKSKESEIQVIQELRLNTNGALNIIRADNDKLLKDLRLIASNELEEYKKLIENEKINQRNSLQEIIDENILKIQKNNEISLNVSKYNNSKDKLKNLNDNLKIQESELLSYIENKEKILTNHKISQEIKSFESKILEITEKMYDESKALSDVEKQLLFNEFKINENLELIKQLQEDYIKEKSLRLYVEVHGDDGLSKHIILSILPQINSDLAILLEDICDFELSIRFDDKQIEFIIEKGGEEQHLFESSGFEKTLSCLALHYVNCRMTTLPISNNLILDEILGRVSDNNLKSIVKIIKKLSEVFNTVDLITHTHGKMLKTLVENEIIIVKTNHISKIIN